MRPEPGQSPGGWGSQLHLRVEGQGKQLVLLLTPGQRQERSLLSALLDDPHGVSRVE